MAPVHGFLEERATPGTWDMDPGTWHFTEISPESPCYGTSKPGHSASRPGRRILPLLGSFGGPCHDLPGSLAWYIPGIDSGPPPLSSRPCLAELKSRDSRLDPQVRPKLEFF